MQNYEPYFTDSKLVGVETSSYRRTAKQSDEDVLKASAAYQCILREKQRLLAENWCQESHLHIEYRLRPRVTRSDSYRGYSKHGRAVVKLTMIRIVEGDLSRLALRLMAGLAEFKGVKLDDDNGEEWNKKPYRITNVNSHYRILGQSFADISLQTLAQAKQGKVLPLLLSEDFHLALRPCFVHHSAGLEKIAGIMAPHMPNDNFIRTQHACREGQ